MDRLGDGDMDRLGDKELRLLLFKEKKKRVKSLNTSEHGIDLEMFPEGCQECHSYFGSSHESSLTFLFGSRDEVFSHYIDPLHEEALKNIKWFTRLVAEENEEKEEKQGHELSCDICGVSCNSLIQLDSHKRSRRHMRKVAASAKREEKKGDN